MRCSSPPNQQQPHGLNPNSSSTSFSRRHPWTYRATILQDAVREPAVALSSDLYVVGPLDEDGFLQVACLLVHVGDAVLAVVSDVLGAFGGQETEEGHLDVGSVGSQVFIAVTKLEGRGETLKPVGVATTLFSATF